MVFIIVSTRPGSWRLAAIRPVFGSVFAFRPLNEEYCIPDTVHTTSALFTSGEISFSAEWKGRNILVAVQQGADARHSCHANFPS
jgi:hypothetical protein